MLLSYYYEEMQMIFQTQNTVTKDTRSTLIRNIDQKHKNSKQFHSIDFLAIIRLIYRSFP